MIRRIVLFAFACQMAVSLFAQENTAQACADGIDNDGDGLIDCADNECANLPNQGCTTCFEDGLSFADIVIDSDIQCPDNLFPDPESALGVSDYREFPPSGYVSLGGGGSITLGFTNNLVINSGDNEPDIWVFEIGPLVEASSVELRPCDQNTADLLSAQGVPDTDGDGFFDFGQIAGSLSSLDIDDIASGHERAELKFNAIQITDVAGRCNGLAPGVDIDAVCALSSLGLGCNETDCAGTPNGTAEIDACGECLEPNDPAFNQSCLDCAGTLNGTAEIDACGECLEPTDPAFDQSCVDCAGTPYGTAEVDACGECLEPTDPAFNQSCVDCAGTPNGTAEVDDCGECLEPTDPTFNQSCVDCAGTPNGTAEIDDCGACLEPTDPAFNQSCVDCAGTPNGTAQVDFCGVCLEPTDPDFNLSCLDEDIIYIPNAFSPNGDGNNDRFQVYIRDGIAARVIRFAIFDRWGGMVYESGDFDLQATDVWWDGTLNGREAPAQVYVYFLEIEFPNGTIKSFKGEVLLVR